MNLKFTPVTMADKSLERSIQMKKGKKGGGRIIIKTFLNQAGHMRAR